MSTSMSRREFLRMTGFTGAALLVSACTGVTAPAGSGGEGTDVEPVTILSMTWGRGEQMETLAEMFGEANDSGITVEGQTLGWADYWTKLNTLYASGSSPDVAWTHTAWVRPHAELGVISDLTPRIEATADFPDDWFESVWILFAHEGGHYGTNWDVGVQGIWWNRNLYEEAGLTGPGEGSTYDDLLASGLALTTDRAGNHPDAADFSRWEVTVWGMSNMIDNWINEIRPQAVAWGADIFNADDTECTVTEEGAIQFLQWYQDAVQVHNIHPSADLIEGVGNLFVSGSSALISSFPGVIEQFDGSFVWEISPYLMGGQNGAHTLNVGGSAFSIPIESPNPDAAWEWLLYNASEPAQRVWASTGIINPRKSTAKMVLDEVENVPDTFIEFYLERIDEFGVPVWQHKNRAQINTALRDEFELVWLGQRTVEEAAAAVKPKVDELLADA
ncbi:sugar ABC transporter substrate-binding protein [Chloroflexi bacterium TSY]|nr:sugar ABC transporter substrate-binding protein [Chloroflexi bacterium TSY]